MNTTKKLHLYEEILLLGLRDKVGSVHFGINLQLALAGAIVAELLLDKNIIIQHEKKKKFVKLTNNRYSKDQVLDSGLEKLRNAKRRGQLQAWVSRLANVSGLKQKAAESLCQKGVLKMEESKVLLIFKRKLYPEINPKPEKELIAAMSDAILSDSNDIDPHTLVLISICESTGMLKHLFEKKMLKERKSRIKEIMNGNLVGKATKEAVEALQAAIMVATLIPVMTVAVTN